MLMSIEYDNVLEKTAMQLLIRSFIEGGITVYLLTSRTDDESSAGIHAICDFVGIPIYNRYFTNGSYKTDIIKQLYIPIHIDGDLNEVQVIRLLTKCKAIKVKL